MASICGPVIRATLTAACTEIDRRQERAAIKRGQRVNIYALGIMLGRVDEAVAAYEAGTSLPRACYDNFQGTLLALIEKRLGLPLTNGGHASANRPA